MKVRIVLVRPRNPLNIGAAARGMANFGFDDMVVVKPFEPVWRETTSAVGAEKLVLAARAADTLSDAVGDYQLVLGTTAVRGRDLQRPVIRSTELNEFIRERGADRVAILFGNEKSGLSNAYLEKCHAYLTVPTSAEQPSLNLSHAVTVVCYELSRARAEQGVRGKTMVMADAAALEQLVIHAMDLFKAAGYLTFIPARRKAEKIRRAFLNWRLGASDVRLLHGIFRYLGHKMAGTRDKP